VIFVIYTFFLIVGFWRQWPYFNTLKNPNIVLTKVITVHLQPCWSLEAQIMRQGSCLGKNTSDSPQQASWVTTSQQHYQNPGSGPQFFF
jgi:hypothetical protein